MSRKTYTAEQIINRVREVEVLVSQGATVGKASKKTGMTVQTHYRWRKGYGGMRVDQARRLMELERESTD
ncbi:MAG: transposase [Dehalococcoidia bacterium]|nr:transposase [Dehalococcoidia bacterium]